MYISKEITLKIWIVLQKDYESLDYIEFGLVNNESYTPHFDYYYKDIVTIQNKTYPAFVLCGCKLSIPNIPILNAISRFTGVKNIQVYDGKSEISISKIADVIFEIDGEIYNLHKSFNRSVTQN